MEHVDSTHGYVRGALARTGARPKAQLLYLYTTVLIGILYGTAIAFRYLSPWSEGDTSFFARVIASLIEYRNLLSGTNLQIYPQGFAYQTWAATLTLMTGISVPVYIQLVCPILGCGFLALFGFTLFRCLLNSDRLGFYAALLLFMVPELIFVVARGNHEKLTISFTLLAAQAFYMSSDELFGSNRKRVFVAWVACFYLTILVATGTNVYFGSAFIYGLTIILLALTVFNRFFPYYGSLPPALVSRLKFAVATSWLIVAFMLLYGYPPAGKFLVVFETAGERLRALFLSFEPTSNPYAAITETWNSPEAYRVMSLFRWLLFAGSFVAWLVLMVVTLRRRQPVSLNRLLLLAFYAAFGFLLALALPVDLVGLDVGTNLQVRLYVYFALFSVPLFALGIAHIVQWSRRYRWLHALTVGGVAVAMPFLSLSGFFKATHEPVVSNVWRFYETEEANAVLFYVRHQPNRTRHLWIGPDDRLRNAYYTSFPAEALERLFNRETGLFNAASLNLNSAAVLPTADYALDSEITRQNAFALKLPLPGALLRDKIYDNGYATITYRGRATPFIR